MNKFHNWIKNQKLHSIRNIFFVLILFSFLDHRGQSIQNVKFTTYTYHKGYKSSGSVTYTINSISYTLSFIPPLFFSGIDDFMYTCRGNFYIGYDSLNPASAKIFFNKPYFDPTAGSLEYSEGTVTYINGNYCNYQYASGGKERTTYLARQCISEEDIKLYNIKAGKTYKVMYLRSKPQTAIIYFADSLFSPKPRKEPIIVAFNGFVFDLGFKQLSLSSNHLNTYLAENSQSLVSPRIPMFSATVGQYYRNGFGLNMGLDFGKNIFSAALGIGYVQRLNKRYYLHFLTQYSTFDYNLKAFQNTDLKKVADTSKFTCTNNYFKLGIELMYRHNLNAIWNSRFLKVGAGLMIRLPSSSGWKYEVGHEAINKKGEHYTKYTFIQNMANIPSFEKYSFYITLTYMFGTCMHQ